MLPRYSDLFSAPLAHGEAVRRITAQRKSNEQALRCVRPIGPPAIYLGV